MASRFAQLVRFMALGQLVLHLRKVLDYTVLLISVHSHHNRATDQRGFCAQGQRLEYIRPGAYAAPS